MVSIAPGASLYYDTSTASWSNHTDLSNDPWWLKHAYLEIDRIYGHTVRAKNKSLHKFGRTDNADSGVSTTVSEFQGTVVNETYATSNSIDRIVSSSSSDTGSIYLEGHTISGSDLTFVTQYATLNGQTPVTLTTPMYRANRIRRQPNPSITDDTVTNLVGNIYVYDSTAAGGVTAGVPNTAAATKAMITAGSQQTHKCATSLSSVDYWIITDIKAALTRSVGTNVNASIEVQYRTPGGVFIPLGLEGVMRRDSHTVANLLVRGSFIIPPNSDIKMVTTTDTNDSSVSGFISGILASIV